MPATDCMVHGTLSKHFSKERVESRARAVDVRVPDRRSGLREKRRRLETFSYEPSVPSVLVILCLDVW